MAAGSHVYKTVTVKATLSENGNVQEICCVCGDVKRSAEISKVEAVSLAADRYTYNGKARRPSVAVKDAKGKKIAANSYRVSYKNNKQIGRATVVVTLRGNYKGTIHKTFDILPKPVSISRLKAAKKGFQMSWKKQNIQADGYQIQYCINRNFKGKTRKNIFIKKAKTFSKKITKLKARQKYYVRLRTLKNVKIDGKTTKFYSDWSNVKTVRAK